MQRLRELGNAFRNFAIFLSFIVNIVLLVIVGALLIGIFQIKNGVAEPLIDGLHENFVAMNEARIVTTIQVEDEIPINFTLPLEQQTNVVLAEDVSLPNVPAIFYIEGGAGSIQGSVNIILPKDTILPVFLDLDVPVDQTIPISLSVPVNIPMNETQLSEPFVNLRLLVEPYVKILDNLPGEWDETPDFAIEVARGRVDLMADTEGSRDPWKGFADETGDTVPTNNTNATPTPGIPGNATPTVTPFPSLTPTPAQ